jgi:hypothetical protein
VPLIELSYPSRDNSDNSTINLNDSTINLDDSTINLDDSTINLDDSTINLDDRTINRNDSTINLDNSTINLNDPYTNKETEIRGKKFQDSNEMNTQIISIPPHVVKKYMTQPINHLVTDNSNHISDTSQNEDDECEANDN